MWLAYVLAHSQTIPLRSFNCSFELLHRFVAASSVTCAWTLKSALCNLTFNLDNL